MAATLPMLQYKPKCVTVFWRKWIVLSVKVMLGGVISVLILRAHYTTRRENAENHHLTNIRIM